MDIEEDSDVPSSRKIMTSNGSKLQNVGFGGAYNPRRKEATDGTKPPQTDPQKSKIANYAQNNYSKSSLDLLREKKTQLNPKNNKREEGYEK